MPVIWTRMQPSWCGGAARQVTARARTRATEIAVDQVAQMEAILGLFGLHSCGFVMKFNYKYGASRLKLALFLRLHENDMQVTFSFLYHLSRARMLALDCLKTDVCEWPARAGGAQPITNQALDSSDSGA
jgi:hypothetical protein